MSLETVNFLESLETFSTMKRFFTNVSSFMSFVTVICRNLLHTLITGRRFFINESSFMKILGVLSWVLRLNCRKLSSDTSHNLSSFVSFVIVICKNLHWDIWTICSTFFFNYVTRNIFLNFFDCFYWNIPHQAERAAQGAVQHAAEVVVGVVADLGALVVALTGQARPPLMLE